MVCTLLIAFVAIVMTLCVPIIFFADENDEGTSTSLVGVEQYNGGKK